MAYTPIFDSLFEVDKKINLTDVAVFGAVWRYAQGKLKKCIASPKTISEGLGLSTNTVRASLKKLCSQEFQLLEDLTPEANSKAHEYAPTAKALTIIARETKKEEAAPEPESIPVEEEQGGVPETGTQELVPSEDGIPETGRGGYQILVGGVPEIGTKERINIDINRQEEESPPPIHEDYLGDVLNGQGKVSEQSASNPDDQWFEYRDKALKAFPGDWGRTPEEKEIKKNLISGFVANTPDFSPDHWAFVIQDSIGHGVGSNNISRFIEVYPFKNYEDYLSRKYPKSENGRDSPGGFSSSVDLKISGSSDKGYSI